MNDAKRVRQVRNTKIKRKKWLAAGLCGRCGRKKGPRHSNCLSCRVKMVNYTKQWRKDRKLLNQVT